MLTRLYIRDFALIEEASIEFGPGLNVITGETGAGKSILIGALYSILGGPTSAEQVRGGADKFVVEGFFEFAQGDPVAARLRELDVPLEDGQLILRRELQASGRSRAFAHGLGLPLRRLRQIGALLVDLHGQHEHQSLLDPSQHLLFLDAYGGLDHERQAVSRLYRAARQAEEKLARLDRERAALIAEEELRLFQLGEIRALSPRPGEEGELENELHVLENAEKLAGLANDLGDLLYQREGAVYEQLGQARRLLDRLLEIDLSLGDKAGALQELLYGVEDLARTLGEYARRLEMHPERAEELRARLESLRALKKKYGGTLEKVVAYSRELEQRQNRSRALDEEKERAARALDQARQELEAAGAALSLARQRAAASLAGAVQKGLGELGMPRVKFQAQMESASSENGLETVQFYLAPNPGEALRPLARIASGGEISRIMLVLKELVAGRDAVPTLVFDEIDIGISGRVAAAVGRRMQTLSQERQILVITHLPQIASRAARHFSVRKRLFRGRTITEVVLLGEAERAEEIAALLASDTVSDTARQHAREMLQ
jgi:DNA repair protein RecN (Recombination protein N)